MHQLLLLISLELHSRRWNPPIIIKNLCVINHCLSNNELLRVIAIDKNLIQSIKLTFILSGYFLSCYELPYWPCQHVLRHKQSTNKQWKVMLSKWQQWVQYIFFNPTVHLLYLWAWNIWVNHDPSTWKDDDKITPHNVPDCLTMCEVTTMISCQEAAVDRWDGTHINKGTLSQVVDKKDEQHYKG